MLFKNLMSYLSLLPLGDGELVVDPEPRVEPDLGSDPDLEVDVGAHLLKVIPVRHDARPVTVVIPRVGCSQVVFVWVNVKLSSITGICEEFYGYFLQQKE